MRLPSTWCLLAALGVASPLTAQLPVPLVIGGHLGVAVPSGDIADSPPGFGAESGPSFGGSLRVEATPMFGVLASYERVYLGCDICNAVGLDDNAVLEAIGGGIRVTLPATAGRFVPWLEGTLVRQTLGFSGDGEDFTSEAALGFTAGAGVTVPLMDRVEISPRLRYFSAPAEFDFSVLPDRELDASAVLLDVGLGIRL